jgi:hypothetical protein
MERKGGENLIERWGDLELNEAIGHGSLWEGPDTGPRNR